MSVAGWEESLRASLLTPNGAWQQVDVLETVDSTNAESLRRPRSWRLLVAAEQTAGRGRRSRSWASPAGGSVAVSATLPLTDDPGTWGWVPLFTGLAMYRALAQVTGEPERFTVKWPNDVLAREPSVGGQAVWRKVCGVLCEVSGGLVVAGAGVNLGLSRADLPVATATSLRLCGHPEVAAPALVVAFARAVAEAHADWRAGGAALSRVQADYRRRCATIGASVRLDTPGGSRPQGVVRDVDAHGRLVMQTAAGIQHVAAGDVVHLRGAPGPDPWGAPPRVST